MNPPGHRQHLAAILAADAVGYSRLMAGDAQATVAALDAARALFQAQVGAHGGRIVDTAGDSVLAVFDSAVGAVHSAIAIQQALSAAAESVPDTRRMAFRIGLHLGDVIEKADGSVYGDGVNLAARLQALAMPGGIALSGAIHALVRTQVAAGFDDHGEQRVKNIDHPVQLFTIRALPASSGAPVSAATAQAPPPAGAPPPPPAAEGPSIAVLPFTNMSGDPEQEYFSDGISEDIITDLSRVAGLMVVARNSSFAYKNKSPDLRTVGRELGVRSVLEGSIRRSGSRVRITAQLIDAATGGHLWAERFDRELTDIFVLQDEVTERIVAALRVTLQPGERAARASSRTQSVAAHDAFLLGRELLLGAAKTRDVFERIVAVLRRAVELDPSYAEPYAGLGMAWCLDFQNHWSGATDSLDLARHFVALAVEKGADEPYVNYVAAVVAFWSRDLEGAVAHARAALARNPNHALACGTLGLAQIYRGHPREAVPSIQRAITLDPVFAQQYWHFLGSAHLMAGDYELAVHAFGERIRLAPRTDLSRAFLASALGHLGRADEARAVWEQLRTVNPAYSLDEHLARLPFHDPTGPERVRAGLHLAGLPA